MPTDVDDADFAASAEPYRRELHVHAYRMLDDIGRHPGERRIGPRGRLARPR